MPEQQVELPLLVSCSGSDGISSDSLMVAGIGAGYNSVGLTARSTVGFINGLERKAPIAPRWMGWSLEPTTTVVWWLRWLLIAFSLLGFSLTVTR